MKLVKATKKEVNTTKHWSSNRAILEEFVNSGEETCWIDGYSHKTAKTASECLKASAKRFGYNVQIGIRQDRVFIMKKV